MAIFEFSSSNGLSSFNLLFECRSIRIVKTEDDNESQFSYMVRLQDDFFWSDTWCDERGYEEWEMHGINISGHCITTFQG